MKKISKKQEIQILKGIKKDIEDYVNNIDDRNSIKLQYIKSDMQKILKKRKNKN